MSIALQIRFKGPLYPAQQASIWDELIHELEQMNVYAGGGSDNQSLNWTLDCSNAFLRRSEIIDRLGYLLIKNESLILHSRLE